MTQSQFAQRFGVRRESVSDWERGITHPTLSISQVKVLNELLHLADLNIEDIAEDLPNGSAGIEIDNIDEKVAS